MNAGFKSYCERKGCSSPPAQDPPFPAPAEARILKTQLYGDASKGSYFEDQ
jgi:hypothetical protein